jgi:predicted small integral membrane protein
LGLPQLLAESLRASSCDTPASGLHGNVKAYSMLAVRLAKVACAATLALYMALVAFGNLSDYGTNFTFLVQVLDMDDLSPASHIRWRAVTSPLLHQASYLLIILAEIVIAVLSALGVLAMARNLRAKGRVFDEAKKMAVAGLALGFLLYEGVFVAVGGEWFGMWQAREFDAVGSAFRIATIMLGTLIFVSLKDEDLA